MSNDSRSTGRPSSLALTTAEEEYLRSGETGGYRASRLDSQIREKRRAIPERVNRLAEDIECIDENAPTSKEQRAQLWRDTLAQALDDDQPSSEITELRDGIVPKSPTMAFGRQLGQLTNSLLYASDGTDLKKQVTHLTLGFLMGAYLDNLSAGYVDRNGLNQVLSPLVDDVGQLAGDVEERRQFIMQGLSSVNETDHREMARDSLEDHVRTVLNQRGLADQEELQQESTEVEVLDEAPENYEIADAEDFFLTQASDADLVERVVGHLMNQDSGTEFAPNTYGADLDFWANHDAETFAPEEFAPSDVIEHVFQQNRIRGRVELEQRIAEDIEKLDDKKWRGVSAREVFRLIYQGENLSSVEINERLDSRKTYTAQVTALANDLSGKEYSSHNTWDGIPLVTGEKDGWGLSEYGEIVAQRMFENRHRSIETLPDETVNAGIDVLVREGIIDPGDGV